MLALGGLAAVVALVSLGETVEKAGGGYSSSSSTAQILSKEEWREKVKMLPELYADEDKTPGMHVHMEKWSYGPGSLHGDFHEYEKAALLAAVGPPDHYATADGDKTLYWICSDGQIVVTCSAKGYDDYGVVAGVIEDF